MVEIRLPMVLGNSFNTCSGDKNFYVQNLDHWFFIIGFRYGLKVQFSTNGYPYFMSITLSL